MIQLSNVLPLRGGNFNLPDWWDYAEEDGIHDAIVVTPQQIERFDDVLTEATEHTDSFTRWL